jgi:molecular chaperone DnaK
MQRLPSVVMLSLVLFGCQNQRRAPLVVETATPIVGAGGVTIEALGIETLGGVFTPLIKPGTAVPCSLSEAFSTASEGQSQITLAAVRGTNHIAAKNHLLGRFQIVGISSAPRGTPHVEVMFAITEQQILISARDLARKTDLEIRSVSGETRL